MLETSTLAEGDAVVAADHGDDGDRNSTANRWPREETMALLKIRSEMVATFRDTSPKAPLWEQVSRKLAELGYNRSAKKCKEKFENIYKYHRRTKEGRSGKKTNGGKTYRFFEQLEALDGHLSLPKPNSYEEQSNNDSNNNNVNVIKDAVPCSVSFPGANALELSSSTNSSSGGKKKKGMTRFFEGLMMEVIEKQETLQRKFMEMLDKCERDRIAREEAWKREELARIKREREILAQERSIAAAKDEAVLAFLKKFSQENALDVHLPDAIQNQNNKDMQENHDNANEKEEEECGNNVTSVGGGAEKFMHMSFSRWPKDEVEALIKLRTQLDVGSNNNNKGPLWEEISLAMKNLGYDRSAKRCKEKWENINKYFKRMKEKNKRKPLDSKTCPYYHHLEALYSKKHKVDELRGRNDSFGNNELKPEELLMHIMESGEERRQQQQQNMDQSSSEDADRNNADLNQGDNNEDQDGFQMVANANSPFSIEIRS